MKVKNNHGLIANELITIIVVGLVLLSVIAIIIYQSSNGEKFHIMKYNASNFATSISNYSLDNDNQGTFYLRELIDNGIHTEIKSPFNGASKCSEIDSFVVNDNSKKYVTLKCGVYLIDNQYIGDSTFKIYKVSDWTTEKLSGEKIEERTKYNYKENGSEVYDEYYDEKLFIYMINNDKGTSYNSINEIKSKMEVIEKKYYREKEIFIENQK